MSDPATVTPPTTTPSGTTVVQTTAGTAPAPTTPSGDWVSTFKDADLKGYIQNKGFENPEVLASSYRSFEKLVRGTPQERLIAIPERYEDAEAWKEVYTKLGRPEKPEGYKIAAPAEGGNPEFAKTAATMFHEAGLTLQQGEALSTRWNTFVAESQKAQEAQYQAKLQEADSGLRKEWGLAFEDNVGQAKKAAQAFGVSEEQIDAMEKSIGLAATMKFFHNVGVKMGEADFVTGKGTAKTLTPEGAKSRIAELMTDTHFSKRLREGDLSAKDEWNRLHTFAYPGETPAQTRRG